jgi:inner membrane protein
MLCIAIYLGVITTFSWRAQDMAEQYAGALDLKSTQIHAIPQPISPMNWRLVVATEDNRVHDTMINIAREKEKIISDTSNRAAKIDALYKPVDKAVWRIYRRFGKGERTEFIQDVWKDQPDWLRHYARFHVFKKLDVQAGMPCVEFKDLRTLGARKEESGLFVSCKTEAGEYVNQF